MGYFKNIHEFIVEFNGYSSDITTYDRNLKKSITKTQYEVRVNGWNICIKKSKGRYQLEIQKPDTKQNTFICEGGTWGKIESNLFQLNIFTEYNRDRKLERLLS